MNWRIPAAFVALFVVAGVANAEQIPIGNPSFETPVVGVGQPFDLLPASPTPGVWYGGWSGAMRPDPAWFPLTGVPTPQCGFVPASGWLTQTLASTSQLGYQYTLSGYFGKLGWPQAPSDTFAFEIDLLQNGAPIGTPISISMPSMMVGNGFASFTFPLGTATTNGQPLTLQLRNTGTDIYSSVLFDDLHLSAVQTVPEPSVLAALGGMGLVGLAWLWRRRR